MRKTVQTLLFLVAMLLPWAMNAQSTTVTIGDGTTTSYQSPFCNYYKNGTMELLYTADEIGMAGQIDTIAFNCSNAFGFAFTTLNIYMGTTSAANLSSGWEGLNDVQLVYSATNGTLTSTTGWEKYALQTPFYYNGSENLVVVVCRQSSNYSNTHKYYYTYISGYGRYVQSDSYADYGTLTGASAQTGSTSTYRANIQLSISPSGTQPCIRPATLNVSNITATTADVSFTPFGTETQWLGTIEPAIMGMNSITLNDTTLSLMMLSPNTQYTISVRAICGEGDTSTARTTSFRTSCVPLTMSDLPFAENFNSYSTGSSASISPCWTKGTNSATPYPYPTSTSMGETSNALYFYSSLPSSSTTTPTYSYAALPQFSGNVQNLMLTFDAKSYSSTSSTYYSRILVGVMSDPTDISTFVTVDTIGINGSSVVENVEVIFSNYTGEGQYVAFYDAPVPTSENPRGGSYNYSYMYVDNVVLQVLPTCMKPTNLATTAVNAYDATLTWNERSSATQWEVTLVSSNDTLVYTANSNPFTATGLTPNTDYTACVKSLCSATDMSEASRAISFTTQCAGYTAVPYTQNFDNFATGDNPNCWTVYATGSNGSVTFPSAYNHSPNSHSTPVYYEFESNSQQPEIAAMPAMANLNTLKLEFYARSANNTPVFEVGVMEGSTFVPYDTITVTSSYAFYRVYFNNYNGTGDQIAFRTTYAGSGTYTLFLDDLTVDLAPTCIEPASVSVDAITSSSVTLSWADRMSGISQWRIGYAANGAEATYVVANSNPYTLTDLTPNTSYTFTVQDMCSSEDLSAAVSTSARTLCATMTAPWTENFEGYANYATSYYYSNDIAGNYPACWPEAVQYMAGGSTAANAPQIFMTNSSSYSNGSNRLVMRGYSNNVPAVAALPLFSNGIETLQMEFDYRMYSASYGILQIGVMSNPADTTTFVMLEQLPATAAYTHVLHDFSTDILPANAAHIALRYIQGSTSAYNVSYIDEISITLAPSCKAMASVASGNITATSAVVNWTPRDVNQNNFQVAYGTVNDLDSMTMVTTSNTSRTLTGLAANTDYYVYVRAICDTNDQSEWSDVLVLHTMCTVADSPLFSDDFESYTGDEIPECWTQGWYYQNPTTGVKTQPFKTNTSFHHSGSRAMTLQDQGTGTSSWMSTRQLPIDRSGKYALSLWVYRQSASGHPLEGLKFWASSSANDTTGAVLLGEVHRHYGAAPAEAATGWYNYQFPIETSGNKYIIFEGYSTFGASTYFDDVEVIEIPCEKAADYTENFENQETNMVPLCWDNTASTSTTMNNTPHYIWGTYSYNGNKMMRMYNYFVQSGVATTNSPAIVLDSLNRELVFDFAHHANSGAVYVRISNDGGNTFTDVDTLNHDGNGSSNSDPGTWTSRSISLADYAGDTIILQFYTVANYGNGSVFIDNLQVREVNNCPIPTDVTAEVLSANSAEVSWNGDATEYIVAYGTGSNPELMDTVHAFATTAVINGLSAETNYNFFVQSVCGESTSYWSLPASAYTGYCQPAPTSVDGQGIVRLQFGSGDQVVDNTTRPTSAPYYGNYASMVGAVAAGTIADVSITYQTGYTYGTIIWVDWDNSLTFDANEVVYVGEAPNTNPTTLTASFPISATTATGMYRMRIAGADSYYDSYTSSIAAAAGANPCPNSTYTIVHDYTLNVTEAANCAPVASVVVNNITNSTATISWSLLDTTQSNFAVAYGTVNDIDSMTVVNVTTTNVTLTGLTDATTYYVSVKAVCGATDQSTWSNAISFTTELCDAANQCALTVEMTDSYGDGWNGGYLNFVDAATNTTVASLTLSTGSYQTANVNVCNGRTYNIVWSGGMYLDEVSFDIYNSFGALVLSVERPMDGTLLAYTANCTQTLPDSVTISASAMPATLGSVTGTGTYAYGDTVTLTAVAMPLTHFTQWSNGDTNSILTFVATEDIALVANFAYNPVTVTLANANPTMGSTTPVPGTYTFQVGDTVNAMAYAFDGYQFSNWTIAMGLGSGSDTTNPVMLVVPALLAGQNITVTANFEAATANYTVTALSNNEAMGSVLGGGSYQAGATATLTAVPAISCHFVQWNDGDTNATRTIVVTSDTTFTATFAYNPVTVNLSYNDTLMGYTVPAAGTYTYEVGDVINAMAYANTGYHFTHWTYTIMGMSDTTSYNPIAQMIPAMMAGLNFDVVANFEANQYELTVVSNNTDMGTVTGGGIYDYNTTVTLTATPAFNHHFVQWSDGNTDATRTVTVTGDAVYTAIFAINPVTVNLTINDATMGTTTPAPGTYTYQPGTTVEAEAVANEGFRFTNWTVSVMGQAIEYTENPVSVTIPVMAAGMTIDVTANFEAIPTYQVTLTATCNNDGDNHSRQLIGAGRYAEGENVTILIEETDDNTLFTGWYVNGELVSTNSLYSFVMEAADITFEARFEHMIIGIDDVNAESINVFNRNNQIVVCGAENQNVRIFDAVGRLVAQRQANGEEETFAVQHTGVYLVQVGRQAARRVVIR